MKFHGLADLPHGGGIAMLLEIATDVVEDLPLALAQILDDVHRGSLARAGRSARVVCMSEHTFVRLAPPADDFKAEACRFAGEPRRRVTRLESSRHAPVAEVVYAQS